MAENKIYWKGLEELNKEAEFLKNSEREFPEYLPESEDGGTPRRDFLKLMGFGIAAATLAACEAPVKKAIPYLNKPEDITPGVPNYYASAYTDGGDFCSVLVKTREGRPIKIEGNHLSSISKGGVSSKVHASVLSLYDSSRLKNPTKAGKDISWSDADSDIANRLASATNVRILSSTIISPSTKAVINEFKSKYSSTKHISYDSNSSYAILAANKMMFGKPFIPHYDFSKAKTIVSIGADFLGTWISPVEFTKQYSQTRKVSDAKKEMSKHYQFETNLSLSGSNADIRTAIKPSQEGLIVATLYNEVASAIGAPTVNVAKFDPAGTVKNAAADLVNAKGASLVVSGSNDINVQLLVNEINELLLNYSQTLVLSTPSFQRQGDDEAVLGLLDEMKNGQVDALIIYGANPVYSHAMGKDFADAIKKVALTISFSDKAEETSSVCEYILPDHHYLESWNDAEPKEGFFYLTQPTITPLFKTRAAQESLLTWAGNSSSYYDFIVKNWKESVAKLQSDSNFQSFWDKTLHDGVFEISDNPSYKSIHDSFGLADNTNTSVETDLNAVSEAINATYKANSNSLELCIYEKIAIGDGKEANNPWLQEMPDPISKATWDNYICISKKTADAKNLKQNDVVKLEVGGKSVELPILIQPGQAHDTVAVAIGYGRTMAGKVGTGVGANIIPFATLRDKTLRLSNFSVNLGSVVGNRQIAQTQTHNTIMGRPAVQEARLSEYKKNSKAGKFEPKIATSKGVKNPTELNLWGGNLPNPNHLWGMVIDLNSCTGCGACTISCQAENNVAVVGRQEVINSREMHWIRIDRYYSSPEEVKDKNGNKNYFEGDFKALEIADEFPEVVFQPMLCQHCNNAPCETVCPVIATSHSLEGLNQMTYNRCIGTRYCANNCPYKVRRFNWFMYTKNDKFDFNMNDDLGRMVLNPDVTVRSRGVMEKCSMCVQRIQSGKLEAKKEKRKIKDGDIVTACAQSCPSDAIVFGDMLDPESKISKVLEQEKEARAYHVLEELNVRPNISYLTKIRNK